MGQCYDQYMQRWSRRGFLAYSAAQCAYAEIAGKGRMFPSVAARYADPATEFVVIRLTDPQSTSLLPPPGNRAMSARGLLYASDVSGSWQAFLMDMKTRQSKQLTEAEQLDPGSLAIHPAGRGFLHFDGARLLETPFTVGKLREVYRLPPGVEKLAGVYYNDDGQTATFVVKKAGRYQLQVLHLQRGAATTLIESPSEIRSPLPRPRHNSLAYSSNGETWMIDIDGQHNRRLKLADGETPQVRWTTGGRTLQYLNRPPDLKKPTSLREFVPETGEDTRIAETTNFVRFQASPDSSAFVGVSGSKASPYLLLLVRSGKRELALAEHRSSDPSIVNPVFGPNNQYVLFGSDRHGKPAIYSITMEKLLSETDG